MTSRSLFGRVAGFLFPASCGVCGLAVPGGTVCAGCLAELPWIGRACAGCGVPLGNRPGAADHCGDCRARPLPVAQVIAPLHYRFPVDAMLKQLKFGHRSWLAPVLAELVVPALEQAAPGADALVPLPLHRWRHARRGFNQAAEIARALRRRTGLPVRHALSRIRATRAQSELESGARRANVAGAFRARKRLGCRHPLLVDDVVTTGETCRAAAGALLDAGAETVTLLAIARAAGG